jgi:23S rRNA (cytosine1962-C5)-methyltransferase
MWLPYMAQIKDVLLNLCAPKSILLRANRHVSRALKLDEEDQVLLIYGSLPNPEIEFHEYGVRFLAHVIKGHKTGFFLDHRNNRHRVGQLSHGKHVLDVFAYAGGFGVHALANGAKQVTSIDISAQALALAEKNAALNEFSGMHETLCGDAFDLLQQQIKKGIQYDVVVIDPPSFANSADGVDLALNKYETLARLGTQLVAKKGWLILASCSSRVAMDQFLKAHTKAFTGAKTQEFSLIETTGHDIDHAVGFEHGHYLKTAYYRRR